MPRPGTSAALPTAPANPPMPGSAPLVYPPFRHHAWWYPIGVWVILAGFFAFLDLTTTHTITWSVWPIGILGIFMVGLPLLNLLEEKTQSRPR